SAAETAAFATRARKPDETAPFDLLREGWKAQLAEIPYPDGEGGHHPATPGDLVLDATVRGSPTLPEPDQVEAVFSVLAGQARAFDVTPDRVMVLTAEFLERESVHRVLADPEAGSRGDADQVRTDQVRT